MTDFCSESLEKLFSRFIKNQLPYKNLKIFKEIEKVRKDLYQANLFENIPEKKTSQQLINKDSTPPKWGRFLFNIVKQNNFKNCLELGTCLGFSSAYIAAALGLDGKVISIEGLDDRAKVAQKIHSKLIINNAKVITGQFSKVLPEVLKNNNFDFVFIDGHHKEKATLRYFDMIYPSLESKSIVIIDDIHWPTEMMPAWEKLKKDQRISQTFTLEKWGICIIENI